MAATRRRRRTTVRERGCDAARTALTGNRRSREPRRGGARPSPPACIGTSRSRPARLPRASPARRHFRPAARQSGAPRAWPKFGQSLRTLAVQGVEPDSTTSVRKLVHSLCGQSRALQAASPPAARRCAPPGQAAAIFAVSSRWLKNSQTCAGLGVQGVKPDSTYSVRKFVHRRCG